MTERKALQVADLERLAFQNETGSPAQAKAELWQLAARELHNQGCGGDPATFPVRDRYEVSSSGEVWVFDVVEDQYNPL
jgi:hypothetical protein